MRIGLLTDIHEAVEHATAAIRELRRREVDDIICLGDFCALETRLTEMCDLLLREKVRSVWGNHDFGLCVDLDDDIRQKYPSVVIEYMASLKPRLLVGGCHFTHVEPWLNPENLADLWYFEGPPDDRGKLERIFNAVPNRIMFAGHYHRWLLVTPDGMREWNGDSPIRLDHGRYFVVVGALCEGQFAIFDTDTSELLPFSADRGMLSPELANVDGTK